MSNSIPKREIDDVYLGTATGLFIREKDLIKDKKYIRERKVSEYGTVTYNYTEIQRSGKELHEMGRKFKKKGNYEKMLVYYKIGANMGNPECLNGLGFYYDSVNGDYETAKKYYDMAIGKGSYVAMVNLANIYEYIDKDHKKAKELYDRARKETTYAESMIENLKRQFVDRLSGIVKATKIRGEL